VGEYVAAFFLKTLFLTKRGFLFGISNSISIVFLCSLWARISFAEFHFARERFVGMRSSG